MYFKAILIIQMRKQRLIEVRKFGKNHQIRRAEMGFKLQTG